MAEMLGLEWWAWQGLNLRPLRCQHSSYSRKARKNVTCATALSGTSREQTRFASQFYRSFTAAIFNTPGAPL